MAGDRRRENASEESYNPPRSETYDLDLAVNMQLLKILEPVTSDTLEDASDVISSGADAALKRALSVDAVVSTSSSFAHRNTAAQHEKPGDFRKIGAGACGVIYAPYGHSVAIKLSRANNTEELRNDYFMHMRIIDTFQTCGITRIKIPKCYGFVSKDDQKFWDNNPGLSEASKQVCHLPTYALLTERILPLPEPTRTLLIDKFCADRLKSRAFKDASNNDCVVRVYLGSLKGKSGGMFFSLRNLKLHLNQMIELKIDLTSMASDMATALAAMHWVAKTDARDIEFILASSTENLPQITTSEVTTLPLNTSIHPQKFNLEDFHHRKTTLWLLDFNQVRQITMDETGIAMAIEAFNINDPYYPKPLQQHPIAQELWNTFARRYLRMSLDILRGETDDIQKLPGLFLNGVVEFQQKKLECVARAEG
ncbi:hypothetical protein G7Z17_g11443 [Cylindrodendrum hubeiense]|uniref:DUF3669 domain-containing protein n=1 Tax=Cylindrodendrum hubeiense TaxID=595255 RepID=A0A9P5H2V4_9HYPO|nr:hypothetical protein G7Z17_g11443 [Cylindrodendrum hubeiense]